MEITARLLIAPRSWKRGWFIKWRKMRTFLCSISKLSVVRSTRSIIRRSACTITTGRISDENQTSSNMIATNFVKIGKQVLSSPNIKMAARTWQAVTAATAGKSKIIILYFTRQNHALRRHRSYHPRVASNAQEASNAHTTTPNQRRDYQTTRINSEKEMTSHTPSYPNQLCTSEMSTSSKSTLWSWSIKVSTANRYSI